MAVTLTPRGNTKSTPAISGIPVVKIRKTQIKNINVNYIAVFNGKKANRHNNLLPPLLDDIDCP